MAAFGARWVVAAAVAAVPVPAWVCRMVWLQAAAALCQARCPVSECERMCVVSVCMCV